MKKAAKKVDVHVYLDMPIIKLLREEAEKDRRSVTQLIRVIIDKHYLSEQPK